MSKFEVPAAPSLNYRHYDNLKGMDCSRDITEVASYRSPDLLNMISDNGGNPVKRVGWRVMYDFVANGFPGTSHSLYIAEKEGTGLPENSKYMYVTTNQGVYCCENVVGPTSIKALPEYFSTRKIIDGDWSRGRIYPFNGESYLFGNGIYKLNKSNAPTELMEDTYIPEIIISRSPDGTGGTFLESVNLLTQFRTISFVGESEDGYYYLYPKKDLSTKAYKYIKSDTIKVEIMNEDGEFVTTTGYELSGTATVTLPGFDGSSTSIPVCTPKIKLTATPASPVVGQDNVRITFEAVDADKGLFVQARADLLKANIIKAYGYENIDRLFVVTDDRTIRYSEVNNPAYFPDDAYLMVSHKGKIQGLHRYQGYLVAVTDDSEIESTVFFISGREYEGTSYFAVTPATSGTGAIAPGTFDTLVDEPLFLSRNGIYAISNTSTESRTVIRNRSYYIDRKLKEEGRLKDAVSAVWNNYYILCVNGHCYVLDGRSTSKEKGNNTNYVYESYYWENVPAKHMCEYQGELYFITSDGRLCKFNTDIPGQTKYSDGGTLSVMEDGTIYIADGETVPCRWSTVLDDDGYAHYFKTMNKKGSMLTAVPYEHSSVTVSYSKDGETPVVIGTAYLDIMTWANIDFSRFTFNSNIHLQDVYFKKKLKKYKRLQLIFENNTNNEPFGLVSVVKTYIVNNLAK